MLRTATLLHPASTSAFRPTPGASLPGTLASPRTGLAPAGHRELVARLCHDCSFAFTASELLDARGLLRGGADSLIRGGTNDPGWATPTTTLVLASAGGSGTGPLAIRPGTKSEAQMQTTRNASKTAKDST